MFAGVGGDHAATAGALEKAYLKKVRFDHIDESVDFFVEGGAEGLDADRATMIIINDHFQEFSIESVEADGIDTFSLESDSSGIEIDLAITLNGGEIANAAKESIGDTRGTSRAAGDFVGGIIGDFHVEKFGGTGDDFLEFLRGIEIDMIVQAEAVAQRGREKSGAGGGADEGESFQRDIYDFGEGAFIHDEIDFEILHGGIDEFLDGGRKAMDFVDE